MTVIIDGDANVVEQRGGLQQFFVLFAQSVQPVPAVEHG